MPCNLSRDGRRRNWFPPGSYRSFAARGSSPVGHVGCDKRAGILIDRYRNGGDLRRLRETTARDPARECTLLKKFKGIGNIGVDIFFREVQVAWDELYPFADRRALDAANWLGLEDTAEALATHVPPRDFPRLIAALVRVDLSKDDSGVLETRAPT